jgi:hypothetical protein
MATGSSTSQATVSRSDKLGTYVQLRASASDVSDWVLGGIIFNGSTVQVLSQQGVFCKVQVQVDASRTLVGFVKKQHLDFKTPTIQASMLSSSHPLEQEEQQQKLSALPLLPPRLQASCPKPQSQGTTAALHSSSFACILPRLLLLLMVSIFRTARSLQL